MMKSLLFFFVLVLISIACGGGDGGGEDAPTQSAASVTISGAVNDNIGLSKSGRQKVPTIGLSIEGMNLDNNQPLQATALNFDPVTGAYSVSISKGTSFIVSFVRSGVKVMSRVLSSTETQSSTTKSVSLVTHIQATRIIKELQSTPLNAAISKVNYEIFGRSNPSESYLRITNLPSSIQVAVMTFREAVEDINTYTQEATSVVRHN
jgi:hypothetical protein